LRLLIGSVLSGVLVALALPPFDQAALGYLALAPLLAGATQCTPRIAVGLGLAAGITCGLVHGYLGPPFLLLALLLAAAAAGATLLRRGRIGLPWVAAVTCLGLVLELVSTAAPIPLHLALTQHRNLPLIQVASVVGIWGVSALIWWVNAAVAEALLRGPGTVSSLLLGGAALALCGVTGWSHLRAHPVRPGSVTVAVIQEHAGGETARIAPDAEDPNAPSQDELTRGAVQRGARLVVWSELGLGLGFDPQNDRDPTIRLARAERTHLVVGYSEPLPGGKRYNCAGLVGPDGRLLGVHRKIHPYLGERMQTRPGREARAFDTEMGRVGIEICFDTCYTHVTRRLVADGARLIAMPNYDPPVPQGVVHRLHGAVLPFRAVENRVPIIRADANGHSSVIDPEGRVLAQAPLWKAASVLASPRLGDGRGTLFTRTGDWPPYLALLGLAG
jgi:apolipoprotein N-acyltransferase